ncbi:MAG: hypothetical protein ACT6S0_05940 [Roseateles sp.]|uniref:hypothetical protein n=1 Tax=Roseateles sp. TaxID=1971397 RepID=UPI004036DE70
MKALTANLPRTTPPLWVTLMIAAVVGAALMAAFVNTLHKNVRHGEELRQAQRGSARHTVATAARSQAPQPRAVVSPVFQR